MARKRPSGLTLGVVVGGAALAITGAMMVGISSASEEAAAPAVGQISCPDVASELPAIPASAQAEVDRNLALLQTQITEANNRLVSSQGEGGPNFVQNAILGPLADKRTATIDRIAISIGRTAAKPDLDEATLSTCVVDTGATASEAPPAAPAPTEAATDPPAAEATTAAPAEAGVISCPDVASQLPAIPASAQAEVDRNLTLLKTQITEANNRLVSSLGEGGPNFVQNAILGPLADKRTATINRIATAIGRTAAKPVLDVATLSKCSVA
jgi:F0F1-type ATP synthase membrane subunit b/b'